MDEKQSETSSEQQPRHVSSTCSDSDTPVIETTSLKAYSQVFLAFCVICFGNLPFYTIAGLQSSLNGALGVITTSIYVVMWLIGSMLTQTIVAILGLKLSVVLGTVLTSTYTLGFYYPTWPTLIVTSVISGFSAGPYVSVPNVYANIMACSLAKANNRDVKYYVGLFQGIVSGAGFFSGAILGNAASSVIFLVDEQLRSSSVSNQTNMWLNASQYLSTPMDFTVGNTTNETSVGACMLEGTAREVTPGAYYTLLAVTTLSALISCACSLLLVNIPERSFTCMPAKAVFSTLARNLIGTAKMLKVPKYILVVLLGTYSGVEAGYFLAFVTKHFVTECIGIGLVGASVMVFSFCNAMSGVVSGKLMAYTSRTVYSLFALLLTLSLCVFMLAWERQPSYVVVFILSAGLGTSNGYWCTLGTAYLGVVGSKESEKIFGVLWAFRALGSSGFFFISIFVSSTVVSVSILLCVLTVVYTLYFIAEGMFGEKLSLLLKLGKRFKYLFGCRKQSGVYYCGI